MKDISKDQYKVIKENFEKGNEAINYTYRNLTTMDGEQTRVLDEFQRLSTGQWRKQWKPGLDSKEIRRIETLLRDSTHLRRNDWARTRKILEPHISNPQLARQNYGIWEQALLARDYEEFKEMTQTMNLTDGLVF